MTQYGLKIKIGYLHKTTDTTKKLTQNGNFCLDHLKNLGEKNCQNRVPARYIN